MIEPARTLVQSYAAAALVAMAAGAAGLGVAASVLIFWLGGAVATLGVAALKAQRGAAQAAAIDLEAEALAAQARFEAERLTDAPPAADRRRG